MNLTKPAQTGATTPSVSDIIAATSTISVNVGVPGNIKKVVLEQNKSTVRDALAAANLNPKGYDVRVAGASVDLDVPLNDGQTVLLLRPVVGNLDLTKPADGANMGITVNVGVPGNIKKVVLAGNKAWTVGDALTQSGLNAKGYEIRVSGEAVTTDSPINDGQTVLLLRPVVGN
jgi:sulfur carrier protein ThiS